MYITTKQDPMLSPVPKTTVSKESGKLSSDITIKYIPTIIPQFQVNQCLSIKKEFSTTTVHAQGRKL